MNTRLLVAAALAVVLTASCSRETGGGETRGAAAEGWFRECSVSRGLEFRHRVDLSGTYALPEIMGSGCAVFDADGDGRLDLYLVDAGRTRGEGSPNRLFLQGADGRYRDATAASGLGDPGYGMGVGVGDLDNDGDTDVYVANWGPDRLYRNDGGRFTDVTEQAGISSPDWSTSVAILDHDGDGWLDIWVVRYVDVDPEKVCTGLDSRRDYCGPGAFDPVADVLWRNRGDGTFEDATRAAGLGVPAPGLGIVVRDVDGNGLPDVYVANDGAANQLWIARPGGTFTDEAIQRGVAFDGLGGAEAGMGIATGDLQGDGAEDLLVTHLRGETNTLYAGSDRAVFRDTTVAAGLAAPSLSLTGFGVALEDLECDGDLDLAWVTGRVTLGERLPGAATGHPLWDRLAEPDQISLNDGTGRFLDPGPAGLEFTREVDVSRGLAAADLDMDGDVDLVVTRGRGPVRLFENVAPRAGRWLAVRPVDPALRRVAVGAVVTVVAGGRRRVRTASSATSYLVNVDAPLHFGLGEVTAVDAVEVRWPGGEVETFPGPGLDRMVELRRGEGGRR